MSFLKTPSYQKLKKIGQEDLLKDWDTFTFLQQEELALQIEQLDIKTFFQQKKQIHNSKHQGPQAHVRSYPLRKNR